MKRMLGLIGMEIIDKWLQDIRLQCSKITVYNYWYSMLRFKRFLNAMGVYRFNQVTLDHLQQYKECVGKKTSRANVRREFYALLNLYKWARRKGLTQLNPRDYIDIPSKPKPRIDFLTKDELDKVLNTYQKFRYPFMRAKVKFILHTLLYSGIRRSSLLDLNYDDFNLSDMTIKVHAKGGKDCIFPLRPELREAFLEYTKEINIKDGALFRSKYGNRLSKTAFWNTMKRIEEKSGLKRRVYAHLFRHTYGTRAIQSGLSLKHVQELMGHVDISSTAIYTHLDLDELRKASNKISF